MSWLRTPLCILFKWAEFQPINEREWESYHSKWNGWNSFNRLFGVMFNKGNKIAGQPHSISINFIYYAKMGLYPKASNINEITSHIGVTNTEINKMSVQRQIPRSSRQHFASMFNSYSFHCDAVLFTYSFVFFLCILCVFLFHCFTSVVFVYP